MTFSKNIEKNTKIVTNSTKSVDKVLQLCYNIIVNKKGRNKLK